MKIKSTLVLAVAGLFFAQLFSSCNSVEITKRRYNKGFYVDLGTSKAAPAVTREKTNSITRSTENNVTSVPTASLSGNEIREQLNTLSASTKNIIAKKAIRKISREVEAYTATAASVKADNSTNVSSETAVRKVKDTANRNKTHSGGKSQLVALLLAFFVGYIGIHRFYLGYTWQGVVQLITLGGCGIWSLIDFIRIITGDLQPKDGRYEKTL